MKIRLIIILLTLFFYFGCKKENLYRDKFTLKASDERIQFKIDSNSTNLSFRIQYFPSNDTNYLAVLARKFNSLSIYNLNSKALYKKFAIDTKGPNAMPTSYGFVMKNIDTTIVVGFYPKMLYFLNENGVIIRKISYEKSSDGRLINPSWANLGYRPFISGSTLYLFPAINAQESEGILTPIQHKHSPVDIAINTNSGEIKIPVLTLPEDLIGKDVTGMTVCRTFNNNNCFVYHFSIIDGLYVTCNFLDYKKVPIETNYRFKFRENQSKNSSDVNKALKYNLSRDEIIDILYDFYRECYYLVVFQRTDDLGKNIDFRTKFLYPKGFIIILDKDFKHMGDVFFPDNTYSFKMMFITPQGLYISEDHVNNPSYSEDYMRFRLFTLEEI